MLSCHLFWGRMNNKNVNGRAERSRSLLCSSRYILLGINRLFSGFWRLLMELVFWIASCFPTALWLCPGKVDIPSQPTKLWNGWFLIFFQFWVLNPWPCVFYASTVLWLGSVFSFPLLCVSFLVFPSPFPRVQGFPVALCRPRVTP